MNDWSLERLLEIEKKCMNQQDAILIRLFLEGVEIHEMVYLTKKSLDPLSRILTVIDASRETRQLSVSSKCVELYQNAMNQLYYYWESSQEVVPLRESPFLIKMSCEDFLAHESMILEMDSVILRTIYRRLHDLAQVHDYPGLTYLATGRRRMVRAV